MYKCPKSKEHKEFFVTTHVTQEWLVDQSGSFKECQSECLEVIVSLVKMFWDIVKSVEVKLYGRNKLKEHICSFLIIACNYKGDENMEYIGMVKKVFSSDSSIFLLNEEGEVFALGKNVCGELGVGHSYCIKEFSKVNFSRVEKWEEEKKKGTGTLTELPKIKDIFPGHYFTFFLSEDGKVFASGANKCGRMGISKEIEKDENGFDIDYEVPVPVLIDDKYKIAKIRAGKNHTLFLTECKKVLECGENKFAAPGRKSEDVFKSQNILLPFEVVPGFEIKDIACGEYHSFLVSETNQVIGFGDNMHKQIKDSHEPYVNMIVVEKELFKGEKIKEVHSTFNSNFTAFISETNRIFVRGEIAGGLYNEITEIEVRVDIIKVIPGEKNLYFIDKNHEVYFLKKNNLILEKIEDFSNIKDVSASRNFNIYLTRLGNVYYDGVLLGILNYSEIQLKLKVNNKTVY